MVTKCIGHIQDEGTRGTHGSTIDPKGTKVSADGSYTSRCQSDAVDLNSPMEESFGTDSFVNNMGFNEKLVSKK